MNPTLILRSDADSSIGVGHVMRCLALAQAWQDTGGRAVFVWSDMPESLLSRLQREQFSPAHIDCNAGTNADANATIAIAKNEKAAWIVVDGYRFDCAYYDALRASGMKVMAVDDGSHLDRYPVNLLLNPNLKASLDLYRGKIGADTKLLLGPHFALLRREFDVFNKWCRPAARNPLRVLVSFSGGDAPNFTSRVLQNLALNDEKSVEVLVLVGASNSHASSLYQLVNELPFPCEIRINTEDVAAAMVWADVAITAAGSIVWELACMKLPALIGAFEENQLAGLDALRSIPSFRVWPVEELLACSLYSELTSLLATAPSAFGDFDAAGANHVAKHLALQ